MSKIVKKKLKIEGMHCASCAMSIDFDLEDLGVKSAKTSYTKQETEVEFDEDKIKPQKIVDQIKKTGYRASF
jgi:copper chaperone CopZ